MARRSRHEPLHPSLPESYVEIQRRRRARPGEFTRQVKDDVRSRAQNCCEHCGVDAYDAHLVFHHMLGLALAQEHHPDISVELLGSAENALLLCPSCHTQADEKMEHNHPQLALQLRLSQRR